MRHTDGVKRKCCPICGGKITISDLYQYSMNYTVLKNGRISKTRKKEDCGSMEVSVAGCSDCGANWSLDDFMLDGGFFIDLKYMEDNQNV